MISDDGLSSYLAGGGKLSAPDNAPPRYRGELMRLMAVFVDSRAGGCRRASPTASTSPPACKERITAARIVLEKFGHAEQVLGLHGAVRRQHRAVCQRPSLGRPPRPQRRPRHPPDRRRHAPQRLPLPDPGLGRRGRAQLPHGPRQRDPDRRAGRLLLPAARRRHDRRSCRSSSATPSSARQGLRQSLAAGHDPTDAQASVNYWYPRVADTLRPRRTPTISTPIAASACASTRTRSCSPDWRANVRRRWRWPSSACRQPQLDVTTAHAPAELRRRAMGRRHRPPGRPWPNAVTGEPVAEIDSTGLDFAAMLAHARTVGGPALRRLTFHQRALHAEGAGRLPDGAQGGVLRALQAHRRHPHRRLDRHRGRHRHAVRLCQQGPARAARTPPSYSTATPEAAVEGRQLRRPAHLRAARRASRSTSTPSTSPSGACWRRSRPTLLAGVPAIVKPASQTAYVAELMVRRIVESGILPEGALQLVCGAHRRPVRPPDRPGRRHLHRLGRRPAAGCAPHPQGDRATRSASPWRPTRSTSRCSAPTPARARPEFDLFVKEVAREMTVKAGQKCTAIRRALVPRAPGRAPSPTPRATGWPGPSSAIPPNEARAHGPARQPRPARRGPRARPASWPRSQPSSPATPTRVEVRRRRPGARRLPRPDPAALRRARTRHAAVHDVEAFGPVSTLHAL